MPSGSLPVPNPTQANMAPTRVKKKTTVPQNPSPQKNGICCGERPLLAMLRVDKLPRTSTIESEKTILPSTYETGCQVKPGGMLPPDAPCQVA